MYELSRGDPYYEDAFCSEDGPACTWCRIIDGEAARKAKNSPTTVLIENFLSNASRELLARLCHQNRPEVLLEPKRPQLLAAAAELGLRDRSLVYECIDVEVAVPVFAKMPSKLRELRRREVIPLWRTVLFPDGSVVRLRESRLDSTSRRVRLALVVPRGWDMRPRELFENVPRHDEPGDFFDRTVAAHLRSRCPILDGEVAPFATDESVQSVLQQVLSLLERPVAA